MTSKPLLAMPKPEIMDSFVQFSLLFSPLVFAAAHPADDLVLLFAVLLSFILSQRNPRVCVCGTREQKTNKNERIPYENAFPGVEMGSHWCWLRQRHFAFGDTEEKHLFDEITVMASLQPVAMRVGADVVQVRKKSVTRAVVSHSHNYIKYVYAALQESPARWHRVSRNVLSILHYKCCWPSS